MKAKNSGSFELDYKKVTDICISWIIGLLTIYSANTELFNTLLAKYIDKDVYTVIVVLLAYAIKKYVKNYKA